MNEITAIVIIGSITIIGIVVIAVTKMILDYRRNKLL